MKYETQDYRSAIPRLAAAGLNHHEMRRVCSVDGFAVRGTLIANDNGALTGLRLDVAGPRGRHWDAKTDGQVIEAHDSGVAGIVEKLLQHFAEPAAKPDPKPAAAPAQRSRPADGVHYREIGFDGDRKAKVAVYGNMEVFLTPPRLCRH